MLLAAGLGRLLILAAVLIAGHPLLFGDEKLTPIQNLELDGPALTKGTLDLDDAALLSKDNGTALWLNKTLRRLIGKNRAPYPYHERQAMPSVGEIARHLQTADIPGYKNCLSPERTEERAADQYRC